MRRENETFSEVLPIFLANFNSNLFAMMGHSDGRHAFRFCIQIPVMSVFVGNGTRSYEGTSVVQLVARWTTNHYHLSSNLGRGIFQGCFIFDFASLPLEVARPIQPTVCTKVAIKHQSTSSPPYVPSVPNVKQLK